MAEDEIPVHVDLGVLIERQNQQGREIKTLSDSTARQFREFGETTARQFQDLRASFSGEISRLGSDLNQTLTDIKKNIASNETKIDNQKETVANSGRVNWFALIGAGVGICGLAVTIGSHETSNTLQPYGDRINNVAADLLDIKQKYLPASTIIDMNRAQDARSGDIQARLDRAIEASPTKETVRSSLADATDKFNNLRERELELEKSLKVVEKAMDERFVARAEFEARTLVARETRDYQQREIDAANTRINDLFPVSTLLGSLYKDQNRLDERFRDTRPK